MKTWDERVKNVSSGSVVFKWGYSLLSRIIRAYQGWETGEKDTPTHAEIYLGNEKQETISAEILGVRKKSLNRFKKNRIEIYSYNDLTVEQLQKLKSYAYGTVGRLYDYMGLVSFLGNIIKKKLPQSKFANFCSELVAEIFVYAGIWILNQKPHEQHPAEQWLAIKDNPNWKLEMSNER